MAAIVPALRREPDEADVRVGFAPSSVDTWMQLADLGNWLLGSGAQVVAGNFTNTEVTTGNTRVWYFRTKPRITAIQRVWVFFLRTTSGAAATTATVKAPASTGTAVVYAVPHAIDARVPFVYVETLASQSTTEAEITFEVTGAGGTVTVCNIACYEQQRADLALDATDFGASQESFRPGQPILAGVNNLSEEAINDLAIAGGADPRRVALFHWAVPTNNAVTRTTASYSALFSLTAPVLAPLTNSGETTSVSGKVMCSVYAKVAAGSGKVRITTDGSSASHEFTITGTSFAWATAVTLAIDVDDMTASDGRRSTRWDGLQVELQGDGTNALSLAGVSVWVASVA